MTCAEPAHIAPRLVQKKELSPVFQKRAPWFVMDQTNKAKEHKKAQEDVKTGARESRNA